MRRLIYAALLPLLFTFACTGGRHRWQLEAIDTIIASSPERAMAMLDSLGPKMRRAPESDQMRYRLLRIKAADKAFVPHTTDSVIIPIVTYYENNGTDKELAEAYYYAASVYRDMNDAPMALTYFQKALETMPEDGDLVMRSNAYSQTGRLLGLQFLYDDAVRMVMRSYECNSILGDAKKIVYNLKLLGFTYDHLEKTDSSLFYYNKAYEMAETTGNHREALNVLGQMASFYIKRKDYAMAKKCLLPVLQTDSINRSANYNMAADMYMGTEQYDSAQYYSEELLSIGTIYAKKSASRNLVEISAMNGLYDDTRKYVRMFDQYSDSVDNITAIETIAQMTSLYNYQLREKENARLKSENRNRIVLFIIIFSICIIALLTMFYYNKRIRRHKGELEKHLGALRLIEQRKARQTEEYVKANRIKIEQLEQQLADSQNENEELVRQLQKSKADLVFDTEIAETEIAMKKAVERMLVKSEAQDIVSRKSKYGKAISDKEWETIDTSVNSAINDFKLRLYGLYRMSEQEYHICLLIRLGVNTTEISTLLCKSASAVSLARKRLYTKMFGKQGSAKEFDEFIKSL